MKKVVLITGASSGIGRSAVELLLRAECKVYAAARRVERMADLQDAGAIPVRLDLTDERSIVECVESIIAVEGHIDVLVNNAGYGSYGAVESVPVEEARRQFEVNLFGLARLVQCVLPSMRERHAGRIINISSMAGFFSEPLGGWYHATKYAVEALSDALRMELKPFGIKVIIIEPGAIASEWSAIACDNLVKVSKDTPYERAATRHASVLRSTYRHASPAWVIGRAIARAATAKNPRLRYLRGFGAKGLVFLARLLPARWFDWIMLRVMQ